MDFYLFFENSRKLYIYIYTNNEGISIVIMKKLNKSLIMLFISCEVRVYFYSMHTCLSSSSSSSLFPPDFFKFQHRVESEEKRFRMNFLLSDDSSLP